MSPEIKSETRNFTISLGFFTALFVFIYFSALSAGAPGIEDSPLPVWQSIFAVSVAVIFFSSWITLIIHCFKTNYTEKN